MKITLRILIVLIMLLGTTFSTGFRYPQVVENDENPPTLTSVNESLNLPASGTPQELSISRSQSISINIQAIDQIAQNLRDDLEVQQIARLQIFPELTVEVSFDKIENTIQSGFILSGKIKNDPESSIILVSTKGLVTAKIEVDSKQYYLNSNGTNSYRFEEIDQSVFPIELDLIPEETTPSGDYSSTMMDIPAGSGNAQIDVMVVYTSTARSKAGGTTSMENLINLAITETNTGYQNSGVAANMRLAHTAEVAFNESSLSSLSGWSTALSQLTNQDGIIDEVRSLRDQYGADLVVMLVDSITYCGIGWLMTPNYQYDSVGYSIVSRQCATGYYSLAHETGHNMGAHHDRTTTGNATAMYNYSYGYWYKTPGINFRTIMSYECPGGGCTRINNWSNPDVLYKGVPTGIISTAIDSADNRLTLNQTAPVVANFRLSKITPDSPTNLVVTEVNSSSAVLFFTDNSVNEQGFRVERSTDNKNWGSYLTLPANTTTFTDNQMICDQEFFYRVYAYNEFGNSSLSNVVSTGKITCTPPKPLTNIQVFRSIASITINWEMPSEPTTYELEINYETNPPLGYDQGIVIDQVPFTFTGLEKDTTYSITITATNQFGSYVNDPIVVKTMSQVIFLPLTFKR